MSSTSADAMNDYWAKRIAEEQAKQGITSDCANTEANTAKTAEGKIDWATENQIAINKNLSKEAIKKLQTFLNVTADGDFGKGSKKALQTFLGVQADGIVGPATVKALQTKLKEEGLYEDNIDGCFGPNTAKALAAFAMSK